AVSLDLDPSEPKIWADASELQQMILNLLINAEQALVTVDGPRTIVVRTRTDEGEARPEIADSARGIPAATRSTLCDPFFTPPPRPAWDPRRGSLGRRRSVACPATAQLRRHHLRRAHARDERTRVPRATRAGSTGSRPARRAQHGGYVRAGHRSTAEGVWGADGDQAVRLRDARAGAPGGRYPRRGGAAQSCGVTTSPARRARSVCSTCAETSR